MNNNIQIRKRALEIQRANNKKIMDLHTEGKSYKAISKILGAGYSHVTVHNIIKKMNDETQK